MPGRNMRGGKKHKRGKNQSTTRVRNLDDIAKRQDHGGTVVYGRVTKATGNRRFEVLCQKDDEKSATGKGDAELQTLVCSLKGSYRKRVSKDMYVLVQLHDYNVSQGIIINSYTDDEIEGLKEADLWDYPEGETEDHQSDEATDAMGVPLDLLGPDTESETESDSEPASTSTPASISKTPKPKQSRKNNSDSESESDTDIDAI